MLINWKRNQVILTCLSHNIYIDISLPTLPVTITPRKLGYADVK